MTTTALLSGEIMRRKSRKTGTTVVLVDQSKIVGWEGKSSERWLMECVTHGVTGAGLNFLDARNRLPTGDWCGGCQGETPLLDVPLRATKDGVEVEVLVGSPRSWGKTAAALQMQEETVITVMPRESGDIEVSVSIEDITEEAMAEPPDVLSRAPTQVHAGYLAPLSDYALSLAGGAEEVPPMADPDKPAVSLRGQGESTAGLITAVRKALTKVRRRGEADIFCQRVFDAESYEAVKILAAEYVTLG